MGSGIYIALSGAVAQNTALDVAASNIANGNTIGYHAERMSFAEALTVARGNDAAYAQVSQGHTDPTTGIINPTGNPLDLALQGDGYFGLNSPRGVRYSRAGNFRLDTQRRLINADGLTVRKKGGGMITVPVDTQHVTVSAAGAVTALGDTPGDQPVDLGSLEIARFDEKQLTREGSTLFAAQGQPLVGAPPAVVSGALESPNFNVVRGVVDLVKISRTYESLHRMIETYKSIEDRTARGRFG